ncbi:MAG TPA: branched-chain amino acid ABC transporter permease [Aggregatilineales bacterium]|nr:branched-chain amino acid ABC transporter permease [Aggregatilineales bacterium]
MSANIRPAGTFDTSYAQDIALNRTRGDKLTKLALTVIVLLIPVLADAGVLFSASWVGLVNRIAIGVIAVQGLNILLGYAGQTSLGHAAFVAVGAYSAALMARGFVVPVGDTVLQFPALPFWLVIPLAALLAGGIGLIFGLPSLRVKGFYLAMATLAAQFIIPWVLKYPLAPITNGTRPLEVPVPELFGLRLSSESEIFYLIVPLSIVLMLLARNIIRTRIGRAFVSIRDNDLAAEQLGINVFRYKLGAFFLSALYAGIAGALLAYQTNSISLDSFTLAQSIEFLAMLVIGGAGFPLGPLLGVAFVTVLIQSIIPTLIPTVNAVLPSLLPFLDPVNIFASLQPMMFGLVLILFLIIEPRGLAHRWEILKISWKIRPYSH